MIVAFRRASTISGARNEPNSGLSTLGDCKMSIQDTALFTCEITAHADSLVLRELERAKKWALKCSLTVWLPFSSLKYKGIISHR
jgi:hypothetical protein